MRYLFLLLLLFLCGCSRNPCKGKQILFIPVEGGNFAKGCVEEVEGNFVKFNIFDRNMFGYENWGVSDWVDKKILGGIDEPSTSKTSS